MDEKDKTIDHNMAGNKIIRFDVGIKRIHSRHEGIKIKFIIQRIVIYTTNAIESLNSTYRKLNRQRSVFPSDKALLKALYLATFEATKKWTATIRNWAQVYG